MIGIVFPGQGSQRPGMGKDLYDGNSAAKAVFQEISDAVGQDMAVLCFDSDDETLRQTQNAQMALYCTGVAAFRALQNEASVSPQAFAGHSVGEYAALAAAGVLDIAEGAKLVQRRGLLMSQAGSTRPGGMAAVLGLNAEDIKPVLAEVIASGVCVIANDNCPGQTVISGDINAIQAATALLPERGAKRVLPLNVSGAFHSPLMDESAAEMAKALAVANFKQGSPVYSNVTTEIGDNWPELLTLQLKSPVRWNESVQNMIAAGITTFIECGSGEVLSGLLRRIDKSATALKVVDMATLAETKTALEAN